jgi:hypothetical protein
VIRAGVAGASTEGRRGPFAPGAIQAVGLTKAALHVDRADEVLIRKRRSLCAACPQSSAGSSGTSRCLVCTCFIYPKAATASEKCPTGQW